MSTPKNIGPDTRQTITVNGVQLLWKENNEGFTFSGIDSVLFWCRPSLVTILLPLQEEIGESLYSRLVAFEASKGTYEDYHMMVYDLGQNFEDGFHAWSRAVAACGWGFLSIETIDWTKKSARIKIENPFEMKVFRTKNKENEIPFLIGKITGVFTHAFGSNCLAEIISVSSPMGSTGTIYIDVTISNKTLEQALREVSATQGTDEKVQLRAANNALRRNERRLLDVIDTVGDFIWETDRNLKFTYFTSQASNTLKITEDKLIEMRLSELMPAKEHERFKVQLSKLSETHPSIEGEFELTTPSGDNLCVQLKAKLLFDFSGNQLGYVGSGRDITQEKALESRLIDQKKNSEYASKMATLGEMAAGVAHEINTPLATISLLAEQLTLGGTDPEQTQKAANAILDTADRIAKIIQGLKAFGREAPTDKDRLESLDHIIKETLLLCEARFKNSGIEVKTSGVQKDLQILCRSTQIMQVLLNLLNNSFDVVSELPEKWVEIRTEVKNNKLEIQVIDSGKGIPPEIQQKLMQPFYTTKPIGKGTGLGLSISKGIVESHNGTLTYETISGQTCFIITVPLNDQHS